MKRFSSTFLATIVIQLANIGSGVLAARILQPHGRGELAVIFLWPMLLATVGQLGLADAVAYLASRKEYDAGHVYATGLAITALFSVILVAAGFVAIPRLLTAQRPLVIQLSCLYLLFIPLNFWVLVNLSMFLGKGRLTPYNVFRCLVNVSYLAGILVLMAVHRSSLKGFTIASLGANATLLLVSFYWNIRSRWFGMLPKFQYAIALLRYGLKVQVGSMVSLVNLRLDQLFMSLFLPPTALGIYVVAVAMSSVVTLLPNSLGIIAFSDLANCHEASERHERFGRLVRLSLSFGFLGFAGLSLVASWGLRTFFGASYLPGLPAIWVLSLGMVFLSGNVVLAAGFKACGLPLVSSLAELSSFGVMAVTLPFLLPRWGILGAALSTCLAYGGSFAFNAYALHRQLKLKWTSFFQPSLADWTYVQSRISSILCRME